MSDSILCASNRGQRAIELSNRRGGRGQPKRQSRLLSCSLGTSLAVEIVRFQILVRRLSIRVHGRIGDLKFEI